MDEKKKILKIIAQTCYYIHAHNIYARCISQVWLLSRDKEFYFYDYIHILVGEGDKKEKK